MNFRMGGYTCDDEKKNNSMSDLYAIEMSTTTV